MKNYRIGLRILPRGRLVGMSLAVVFGGTLLVLVAGDTAAQNRTQCCFVPGGGKSASVNGLPSGPMTYLILDRNGSNIKLSRTRGRVPVAGRMAVRYAVHSRTVSDRPTLRTQGLRRT